MESTKDTGKRQGEKNKLLCKPHCALSHGRTRLSDISNWEVDANVPFAYRLLCLYTCTLCCPEVGANIPFV